MNLHIVRNSVAHDSRVLKETKCLKQTGIFHSLEIAGFMESHDKPFEKMKDGRIIRRIALTTRSLPKDLFSQSIKYAEWYAHLIRRYSVEPLKVIHCHDLAPLPIGIRLKQLTKAKLIYDAHELQTETFGSKGVRQGLTRKVERLAIRNVDAAITVSPSIQAWYQKRYPDINFSLVRNIPERPEQKIDAEPLRKQFNVPNNALLAIYIGGLNHGRGVGTILSAFQHERVPHHVIFMGSGQLEAKIEAACHNCPRIHFIAPVKPSAVLRYVAGADVGLCLYEDVCLNHRFCLPNKLFETLLTGVPVLAADLPDQAEIVRRYKAGWIVPNRVDSVVDVLVQLSIKDVQALAIGLLDRVQSLQWTNEAKVLLKVYEDLGLQT